MISSLHRRSRFGSLSAVNHSALQTPAVLTERGRVLFVADGRLTLLKYDVPKPPLFNLNGILSDLTSLPLPPKLLRSPTFEREQKGKLCDGDGECKEEVLLNASKTRQDFLCTFIKMC